MFKISAKCLSLQYPLMLTLMLKCYQVMVKVRETSLTQQTQHGLWHAKSRQLKELVWKKILIMVFILLPHLHTLALSVLNEHQMFSYTGTKCCL